MPSKSFIRVTYVSKMYGDIFIDDFETIEDAVKWRKRCLEDGYRDVELELMTWDGKVFRIPTGE